MKGVLKKDHIPVNKYELLVLGLAPITFTEISGIEEELETVDLPDRTVGIGGNTKPVEFTAKIPLWHTAEVLQLEAWFAQCKDPVSPAAKKAGTLILSSISGANLKTFTLVDMFPSKRALPDLAMENEGEYAFEEWTFRADDMYPI